MMGRYIDIDEYRKRLDMICGDGYTKQVIDIFIDWFMSIAESTEPKDVAPVVHAHWIYKGKDDNDNGDWECSHCGCGETHSVSCEVPYCWKCGAKMDEEVE